MRVTQALFWNNWKRNGRAPARPPYRFTEVKKLVLRDSVSSSLKTSAEGACNQQMMEMMNCLKENEFNQRKCSPIITAFKTCYENHLVRIFISETYLQIFNIFLLFFFL